MERRLSNPQVGCSRPVRVPIIHFGIACCALTMAIVIGEYTIANFLFRPAFGPYLSLLGQNRTYEPAAVSVISFALTWFAMGVIGFIGRGSRTRVQIAGAR